MTRARILTPFAAIIVLALVACSPTEGTPVATVQPSTPVETAATGLLTCDELVEAKAVARALTGGDGIVPTPVAAVQPSAAFDSALLTGVGGLACSWRVGEGQLRVGAGEGDWAYLQVSVLPNSAELYMPLWAGDSPSTETTLIDRVTASVTQGETGWKISAPVGDSWVQLAVRGSGLVSSTSRFEGKASVDVSTDLIVAAAGVFGILSAAAPERLAWPALESRSTDAACDGGLNEMGIADALMIDPSIEPDYVMTDSRANTPESIESATRAAAGVFACELRAGDYGMTTITAVRGFAPVLATMTEADSSVAFQPIALNGAVAPEAAIVAVRDDGPRSPMYFTVGETLYEVYSDGTQHVAEAIIAQAR